MQMKLWEKDVQANKLVEQFTIGRDPEFDILLAKADVLGNLAHTNMLQTIGLLTESEYLTLSAELKKIYKEIESGNFSIDPGVEDVHSQVEFLLTMRLGEMGKKVHSGRSRNDQILLDLKLFIRTQIELVAFEMQDLFNQLITLSETHKQVLIPGYTHLQVAMPSSFGLWFGCYAESLSDDLLLLQTAFRFSNQNPLGSAAGYGSSFPLNRTLTASLLGFEDLNYNVMYAQMGRGKVEKTVCFALASVGATLAKMANEMCLFMSQNFNFVSFPEELTTGSSIMPHKKNPDVFELIRAKGNRLQAFATEIAFITTNLPFGYNRDLQIIKEIFIPAFEDIKSCLVMMQLMLSNITIKEDILNDKKYDYLFSVEEVNKAVLNGVPFRDAYKEIGMAIKNGNFNPQKQVSHTHEGSIGNLCNDKIDRKFKTYFSQFGFDAVNMKLEQLLK
ncbi:MAG: argininosuccinate lyase [Bacteroidales bacterium]|nr:argininosuccinate lyase [Bacteroidales bacterium]